MRWLLLTSALATAILSGCGETTSPIAATIENEEEIIELFPVATSRLDQPSGYRFSTRAAVRIGVDQPGGSSPVVPFDFLYRYDEGQVPQLVPYPLISDVGASTSAGGRAGFILTETPFDNITEAVQSGYIIDQPMDIEVGQVYYARSNLPNGCILGVPYYAKLEIIEISPVNRAVKIRILTDANCGYFGLEPGLPTR